MASDFEELADRLGSVEGTLLDEVDVRPGPSNSVVQRASVIVVQPAAPANSTNRIEVVDLGSVDEINVEQESRDSLFAPDSTPASPVLTSRRRPRSKIFLNPFGNLI